MKRPPRTVAWRWLLLAGALLLLAGIAGRGLRVQATREHTQDAFPVLKGPYAGQKYAGPGAELFAPHIVSTGLFESYIAIAPD